jgi:hypothetical protein
MDWPVLIGTFGGVVLGGAISVATAVVNNRSAERLSREARIDNRRQRAYLEALQVMYKLRSAACRMTYDERTIEMAEEFKRDVSQIDMHGMLAYVAAYGSPKVREMVGALLPLFMGWHVALEPEEAKKKYYEVFGEISALENQMNKELAAQ